MNNSGSRQKDGEVLSKARLFLENFLFYGFGGIISKVIPLIMLPIITRLMPDPLFYGLNDLSGTITSFASAIAVLGMYDAMFRYFFEKDDVEYQRDICSTTLLFTLGMSLLVFVLMLILREPIAAYIFNDPQYAYLVYLTAMATLIGATNSIISAPTRMQNKRKIFLITNTVSPIIGYSISVPMLLAGYYVIALPLAGVVCSLIMEGVFYVLNRSWFQLRRFRLDYLRQLLVIAVPLAPTFLVYWVFGSADRIMIAQMIGVDGTGLYAIGSKLGMASQLIYTAFAGGWQYFAFSTMHEENQVQSNTRVFEYLGIISFSGGMFICALAHPIYELLFVGEYVAGYIVSPYLFLAPLLLMLYQVAGNQFLVIKKTWPGIIILSAGAVANILLNLLLIPILGIEGAGIATLLGYAVSVVLVSIVLQRMQLMAIPLRFIGACAITAGEIILWRLCWVTSPLPSMAAWLIATAGILLLYRSDITQLVRKTASSLARKNNK